MGGPWQAHMDTVCITPMSNNDQRAEGSQKIESFPESGMLFWRLTVFLKDGSSTDFLSRILTRRIHCTIFPSSFPSEQVAFIAKH